MTTNKSLEVQITLTVKISNATKIAAMAAVLEGDREEFVEIGSEALEGILSIVDNMLVYPDSAIGYQDLARKISKKLADLANDSDEEVTKLNQED